ncbi:MAG: hypothetical protein ACLR8P_13100 [Clostridium fessum]
MPISSLEPTSVTCASAGCGDRFTHIALDNERRIAFVLIERRKIDGRIHAVIENYIALTGQLKRSVPL